jgi:nicotinate phosphoribosyltransferase
MFYVANDDEIKKGRLTDVYFSRTMEILQKEGIDRRVKAEFIVKRFPGQAEWAVFTGLSEFAELIAGLDIRVRSMKEGAIIRPYEPVIEIEGMYSQFAVLETSMLGLICQASGIATKAARCKKAAAGRPVFSFGARRIHPAIAPMVERNAFAGGCDGVSVVYDAELLGIEPSGTMPHALILMMGDTVTAAQAFDRIIDKKVGRIVLIDTFNDEKVEAIRVAEALGGNLHGIRLDTPASRKGDFLRILEEVRWELDLRGFTHVKLYVSGGIDEQQMARLNDYVDGYGVGTSISNAPVLDFAMDIVEIEGKAIAKRGKMSGAKRVFRCNRCFGDKVTSMSPTPDDRCPCGGSFEEILLPWYEGGKFVGGHDSAHDVRSHVLSQLDHVEIVQ